MGSDLPLVFVGDIVGNLHRAIPKLAKAAAKMTLSGRDALIFVCGDFIGDVSGEISGFISGATKCPVHIYTLGPINNKQSSLIQSSGHGKEGGELAHNITCLGKFGVLILDKGVTVAFLSGIESTKTSDCTFNEEDVNQLTRKCNSFEKIDILLTYQWPNGVENCVPTAKIDPKRPSSKLISRLVTEIRPRMHFAANGSDTLRTPPMHHTIDGVVSNSTTTTFIGLSDLANYKTRKWVYGIQFPITPPKHTTTVALPFSNTSSQETSYFFSKTTDKRKRTSHEHKSSKRQQMTQSVNPTNCWFCLGNENIEKSLILAIADHTYLTLCKGPMTENHVIILPINHISKMSAASLEVLIEIQHFLQAVLDFFSSIKKCLVWYQRCYQSPHLQIECIPVNEGDIPSIEKQMNDLVIQNKLNMKRMDISSAAKLKNITDDQYFFIQLNKGKGYMVNLTRDSHFPVNFGRMVIAHALGLRDRVHWKDCINDADTISMATDKFKKGFRPFNFTIED